MTTTEPTPSSMATRQNDTVTGTVVTRTPQRDGLVVERLTFGRVLNSEWIKARTLRSTWLFLAIIAFAVIAFGLIAALTASGQISATSRTGGGGPPAGFANQDPTTIVLAGSNFAVLLLCVYGVLVGAREFSSGMIRSSLAAVPHRWPVLASKIIITIALLTPVLLVSVLIAFFAGSAVLQNGGHAYASWGDTGVPRAVIGTVLDSVGITLMGVGLGVAFRTVAGGLGALIGGLLFLPTLGQALLPSDWSGVLKYFPGQAASAFTLVDNHGLTLEPVAGALVFSAWVIGSVVLAWMLLLRRDV